MPLSPDNTFLTITREELEQSVVAKQIEKRLQDDAVLNELYSLAGQDICYAAYYRPLLSPLNEAFTWDETPQGHQFWYHVHEQMYPRGMPEAW